MPQKLATLNRSLPPQIAPATLPTVPKWEEIKLPSGLRLILLHDPEAEGVRLEFLFQAGTSWHSNPLTATFVAALLREGSVSYPGSLLSRRLDALGAFVELQASTDLAWMTVYVHQSKTRSLIPYLCNMLTEPEFRQKSLDLYRQRQLSRFNTELLRTRTLAQRAFRTHLFGSHSAYGRLIEHTHFDQLHIVDLQHFHQLHYHPQHTVVIIAGKIRTEWITQIEKGFSGTWNLKPMPDRARHGIPETGLIFVEKSDALQSTIMLGRVLVDRQHPDFPALTLANAILGGYFGSRLMSNLREDKGYTYGVHSQIITNQLSTYMSITADVGSSVTSDAIAQVRKELQTLMNEPVLESELTLVKNYLAGSYVQALDGVFNLALRLRSLIPFGLSLDYVVNLLEELQQTDRQQIMAIAHNYFNPDDMLTVVAGAKLLKE